MSVVASASGNDSNLVNNATVKTLVENGLGVSRPLGKILINLNEIAFVNPRTAPRQVGRARLTGLVAQIQ